MCTFPSKARLEASLRDAGLLDRYPAIAATLRPDILFWRVSTRDADLPIGISKVGGDPDLPPGFDWPAREPFADAAEREDAARAALAGWMRSWPDNDYTRRAAAREIGRLPALHRSFPLAFVAQIDLGAMAGEAGFDDLLPDSGLLSVFYDISDGFCGSPRLFWHREQAARLEKRRTPPDLVDYYERFGSHDMEDGGPVWPRLTHADALQPVSALAIPPQWRDHDAVADWFGAADETPMRRAGDGRHFYGDHLGGWPSPLQGDPETELDGVEIRAPGDTRWRHILSFNVGECWAETRLMALDHRSDGQHYVLMDEDDLAARRFERARCIHQMT